MKKKLMNKRYVKVCAYLQNVFNGELYGKGLVLIANILATSNRVATRTPTKASAPVVETRASLALKHLAIITIIAITGFVISCPNNNSSPWTLRDSGTTNELFDLTYGNGIFVTVSNCSQIIRNCSTVGAIFTSFDGITWTARTSGVAVGIFGVNFVNNMFVAVGDSGTILTSPDGITWTGRASGTANALRDVTYGGASGNELFVAVGDSGTILTSPDGITWTPRTSITTGSLRGITYGNSTFVTVGFCSKDTNGNCSNNGVIFNSPEGITWISQMSGLRADLYDIETIVDGFGSIFVAVGGCPFVRDSNCNHDNPVLTSNNGIDWRTNKNPNKVPLYAITRTANGLLAVGNCPFDREGKCINSGTIVNSGDGFAWTQEKSIGAKTYYNGVVQGKGISVIVGQIDCETLDLEGYCAGEGNAVILTK